MNLQDCNLNAKAVLMAPFIRNEPEESWLQARDKEQIPLSLFDLYCRAGYGSFGAAPTFFKDEDNVLFSYFSLALRSLMLSLVDCDENLQEFIAARAETYHPGKRIDDANWTKQKTEATSKRANEAFRNVLMSLHAVLDGLSEVLALFSQGRIKGLEVGYGQFSRIEAWLKSPPPASSLIVTPTDLYMRELYASLNPIVCSIGPETEWLPYLRLLRNKAAHLGHGFFRSMALVGNDDTYYTYLPRIWPYIWEREMKQSGFQPAKTLAERLPEVMIHQDIIEFAKGAHQKVRGVTDAALQVTCKAYSDFSDFEFNQTAFDQLITNSKHFEFQRFLDV
jgi:hypothetical protein